MIGIADWIEYKLGVPFTPKAVSAFLRPCKYGIAMLLKARVGFLVYEELVAESSDRNELDQIMRVALGDKLLFGKVILLGSFRHHRFEGALHGLTGKIVSAAVLTSPMKDIGFTEASLSQSL